MEITITTDTNPETWGTYVTDETAEKAADELARRLEVFARREWPGTEVTATSRAYPCGVGGGGDVNVYVNGRYYDPNQVRDWQALNAQEEEVATAIHAEWERIWVDVLAELATDDDI